MNKLMILPLQVVLATTAFGNGFVKPNGEFYTKLSNSTKVQKTNLDKTGGVSLENTQQTIGLYGEYGLPTPWTSQAIFSTSFKSIESKDLIINDSYEVDGFSDSKLQLKSLLFSSFDSPLAYTLASTVGLVLPTTKDSQASYGDSEGSSIPANRKIIESKIDRGQLGYSYGIGASALYRIIWLSLNSSTTNDSLGLWSDISHGVQIGLVLPYNSWFQISAEQVRSQDTNTVTDQSSVSLSSAKSASLGLTFYKGLAFELAYTLNNRSDELWDIDPSLEFGLSYRSL